MNASSDIARLTPEQAAVVLGRAVPELSAQVDLPETEEEMRRLLSDLLHAHGAADLDPVSRAGTCSGDDARVALRVVAQSLADAPVAAGGFDRRSLDALVA